MKPDLEAWSRFYKLAVQVRKQAPWTKVEMDQIFVIKFNRKTYYCSIMGQDHTGPSIAIYPGRKGLADIQAILSGIDEGWNGAYLAGNQECLMCYFGSRNEMPEDQMDIVHAVKPGFRGDGKWIFCKHVAPRLYPFTPTNSEIITMTQVLEGLSYGLSQLNNVSVKWDRQYLCISYKAGEQTWSAKAIKCPEEIFKYTVATIESPTLTRELKKRPRIDDVWFVDTTYLFIPFDFEDGPPMNPLLYLLVNLTTERIEEMSFIPRDELEVNFVTSSVIDRILHDGIPDGIVARCPTVYYTLMDVCDMLGIDLMIDSEGNAGDVVNEILEELINYSEMLDAEEDLLN